MTSWCEQCPCHDPIFQRYPRGHIPFSVLRHECGDVASGNLPCCNRGCRAPQLAAGELVQVLERAFNF
eukprot:4529492-Alexandrium_andersonii.AAC.1